MNAVTQHQDSKGECGDDVDIGDFAEVDIATQLLVAIEANHDPNHEKDGPHRFVKKDAAGPDQIVESGFQKFEHAHATGGGSQKRHNNTTAVRSKRLEASSISYLCEMPWQSIVVLQKSTTQRDGCK